ncbi:unnamed protein product, partial [Toxocara canis]|uniref:Kazal-like domain-containing protein n=1 Tax=Toxocara canis TaxID=6265 RepID=A0A183ULV8_TOXCA
FCVFVIVCALDCFPGHIKCGSYCVDPRYSSQCFINPSKFHVPFAMAVSLFVESLSVKIAPTYAAIHAVGFVVDGVLSNKGEFSEEKLCNVKGTMPCKGFGECVLTKWLLDDKADCLDGSDEGYLFKN